MEVHIPKFYEGGWFSFASNTDLLSAGVAYYRSDNPTVSYFTVVDCVIELIRTHGIWTNMFPVPYSHKERDTIGKDPYFMSPRPTAIPYSFMRDLRQVGVYSLLLSGLNAKELIAKGKKLEGERHENEALDVRMQGTTVCYPEDILSEGFTFPQTSGLHHGRPYTLDNINTGTPDFAYEIFPYGKYIVQGNPAAAGRSLTSYDILLTFLKLVDGYKIEYNPYGNSLVAYEKFSSIGSTWSSPTDWAIKYSHTFCHDRSPSLQMGITSSVELRCLLIDPISPASGSTGKVRIIYTRQNKRSGVWPQETEDATILNTSHSDEMILEPLYHGSSSQPVSYQEVTRTSLKTPIKRWMLDRPEGNAAPYYAVANAIGDHFKVFSTNWVEGLSELRSLGMLIPDLRPLRSGISLLPGGAFLSSGFQLLDFLTRTKLIYEFGIRPTASALVEFIEKFDALYKHIQHTLGNSIELSGYARGTCTTSDGYELHISSYAKVVAKFPPQALLCAILGLDGGGILPRLSRVWQTLPFSFVVDWFFPVGQKLKVHEDFAIVLLLDVQHYVTTLRLTSPIKSEELSLAGLSPVTGVEALKFHRSVSIFAPDLVDDRVDYLPPQGPQSVLTAASLAYCVLLR